MLIHFGGEPCILGTCPSGTPRGPVQKVAGLPGNKDVEKEGAVAPGRQVGFTQNGRERGNRTASRI